MSYRLLASLLSLVLLAPAGAGRATQAAEPLRVFLRAGPKTHGPGQHDHPRFLEEWRVLLAERGAAVTGALRFPTAEELAKTDVLVLYAAEGATIEGEERARFEAFLARGGGLVVLHDAVCGTDPQWFLEHAGGAWEHGHSKWLEGEVGLFFTDPQHPVTRGVANFDLTDEIYWDVHLSPRAKVLANSFHSVFEITPQMWVVDDGPHRAFVSLQGHEHETFSHPAWRTLVLRGIAWAGRRDADLLTTDEEVEGLRYPPGGPLPPERAHAPLVLHDDFELSLLAAEPVVVNPISIDWDPTGRPWVVLTPSYPYKQEFSGEPPRDEVAILLDDDRDGRMDRRHTFADGLDLATSLVFHRDGVIVSAAPDILWLRDTDGDDVADVREVLFTGFGYGDTHATVSNLRWGPDGWVYATQGYSGNASRDVRNAAGTRFGHVPNGLFRFRADGSAIEAVSVYGSNTWGLDLRWDGELFFTMANGSHLRHVVLSEQALGADRLPGARSWNDVVDHREVQRISRADREPYLQIDFVGGFTAAAGCLLYDGGAWPAEYEGNHFVCEPTVNLLHRDVLRPDESGQSFLASKPRRAEFLASTDPWFRPVHARTGPDGALYVLDFYNQAAVHNDTRGPRHGPTNAAVRPDRDDRHGRIWRVQHRTPQLVHTGFESTNEWARRTALRQHVETGVLPDDVDRRWRFGTAPTRVALLWTLHHLGALEEERLLAALSDEADGVRRSAALVAGLASTGEEVAERVVVRLEELVFDPSARVRLAALDSLARLPASPRLAGRLVQRWPWPNETAHSRSAMLRVASFDRLGVLRAAVSANDPDLGGMVEELVAALVRHEPPALVARALELLAAHDWSHPAHLEAALTRLGRELPRDFTFPADEGVRAAIERLLARHDEHPRAALATLPLATRCAAADELAGAIDTFAQALLATVEDPDAELDERRRGLSTLLTLPRWRMRAIRSAERFLDPYFPLDTQRFVIAELGRTDEVASADVLAEAFARLTNEGREAAFGVLVERASWAERLLARIEQGEIAPNDLGPHRVFRLRNHPAAQVAARADEVLGEVGLESPEKEALVSSLLPVVTQPGDVARGKQLFEQNCANCHDFDRLDEPGGGVGPALTGMGAHGREHLLPFLVDPNRSVEAAYVEYVAETTDGKLAAGVLTYDGPHSITLASAEGDVEIERDRIQALYSTGRSPMPTGFEDLGADALRDILAFLCAGVEDFRVLDLSLLCSSTTDALYDAERDAQPIRFARTGVLDVQGVPFELLDPATTPGGRNALVLKGGAVADWDSKTDMPQRVEVPVGFALERMHVLGGIAAWGHPFFGQREPVVRWTWRYADGAEETVVLHDGDQFADWIRRHDVPGSRYVEDLVVGGPGQVRAFHLDPSRTDVEVERVVLESFDNRIAPTFLALTAQVSGVEPDQAQPAPELTQPDVLIVGGGSSHDYARWYDEELRRTLEVLAADGLTEVEYTDWPDDVLPRLPELEVLVLANNQPLRDPALRAAILAHVEQGGGLVLLHAATWFNWNDWPEYNARLVGGGARSHEAYGTFDVELVDAEHPLTAGVPARFAIDDELYRFEPDEHASIQVVALGSSRGGDARYPVVWTVDAGAGRVACITLGHDGGAHRLAAFRALVAGAVRWARGS